MKTNRRNQPIGVESLESLRLLSGLPTPGAVARAVDIAPAAIKNPDLTGPTKGTFVTSQSNPDTGKDYHVTTRGVTTSGTPIAVTGDLITPGFIANGKTTGTLTVTTARGTLSLKVSGSAQPGFTGLPSKLGYTITGGTGVFAHHHQGSGVITVAYHVTSAPTATRSPSQSGPITLVFKAG